MKKLLPLLPRLALAALALLATAVNAASTITYFHNDLAGSPAAATNSSGQVIWRESYRPYGERLTNSPASADNKIYFTSRRQDVETGLVYMGARYYDPVIGRFISTDPKRFDEQNPHLFNRYAYANNNPYKYVDPDGRIAVPLARFVLGASYDAATALGAATLGGIIGRGIYDWIHHQETTESPSSGAAPPDPSSGRELDPSDKGGELSKAGRAQQKHGDREGSAFDQATGSPKDKNEQGQGTLDGIVSSPDRVSEANRLGGTDVRESPGGRGARFDKNGKFTGFIEPN